MELPIGSEGSVRAGEGSRVGSLGVRGGLWGGRGVLVEQGMQTSLKTLPLSVQGA